MSIALCRILLGVMLFAHVINAANACVAPALSPAMAFANTEDNGHCNKAINGNSCLQQYTANDQSPSHTEIPPLATCDAAVLTLPRETPAIVVLSISTTVPHRTNDPPSSIRFCSFQL